MNADQKEANLVPAAECVSSPQPKKFLIRKENQTIIIQIRKVHAGTSDPVETTTSDERNARMHFDQDTERV